MTGVIFFCRPKDKKRLLSAVEAIVENDLGVAVIGSNEAILDHYYRMLVSRIRDHEHFKLGNVSASHDRQLADAFQ